MQHLKPFVYPIDVRFRDLDGLGHINNAVYLTYAEQCRTRWFQAAGMTELKNIKGDFPFILARSEIDHLQQGGMTDNLVVEGWIESLGNKSFVMGYDVKEKSRGVLARIKAVLVWFDFASNTSVPIPAEARALLEKCVLRRF